MAVTRSAQNKNSGFIFSQMFKMIRMKINVVSKQFKPNVLTSVLNKIYLIKVYKYTYIWHVVGLCETKKKRT